MIAKLTLGTKLILSSFGLIMITILVGLAGYFAIQRVAGEYTSVTTHSIPKIELSTEILLRYQHVLATFAALGHPAVRSSDTNLAIQEAESAIKQYEEATLKYLSIPALPDENKLNEEMETHWQHFKAIGSEVIPLSRSGNAEDYQKILEVFRTEWLKRAKAYMATATTLANLHRELAERGLSKAETEARRMRVILIAISTIGSVFCLILSLFFSREISKSLHQVVTILTNGSSQMSGEVSQLTHSSTELFSGAQRQAAAIQQTSASMEEIRAMVEKNTQNATSSAKGSEQSKNHAEKGQAVMKEVIHSIAQIQDVNRRISEEVQASNRRMSEVVQVIQAIGSKTKVINDIVFQTKILSFNASVEAARAGEKGKGFSVVAEEVGLLARMSGDASKEITDMLSSSVQKVEGIASETQRSIETLVKESQATIARSNQVALECDSVLEEIVKNAWSVSEMVHEISTASEEQATGIGGIAAAINEIDSATHSNTQAAQLTSSSASTINDQLDTLKSASGLLRAIVLGSAKAKAVARFVWTERYALGVESMDDEHKVLIEKINILAEKIETNHGSSIHLLKPFEDLSAYTRKHFAHEETYMSSIGYPNLTQHKAIHTTLLSGIDRFGVQLKNNQLDGDKFVSFLNDWLIQHILGIDMKYARFSKTRNQDFKRSA